MHRADCSDTTWREVLSLHNKLDAVLSKRARDGDLRGQLDVVELHQKLDLLLESRNQSCKESSTEEPIAGRSGYSSPIVSTSTLGKASVVPVIRGISEPDGLSKSRLNLNHGQQHVRCSNRASQRKSVVPSSPVKGIAVPQATRHSRSASHSYACHSTKTVVSATAPRTPTGTGTCTPSRYVCTPTQPLLVAKRATTPGPTVSRHLQVRRPSRTMLVPAGPPVKQTTTFFRPGPLLLIHHPAASARDNLDQVWVTRRRRRSRHRSQGNDSSADSAEEIKHSNNAVCCA